MRRMFGAALAALLCAPNASAQNWSFDARKIALGAVGSGPVADAVEAQNPYRAIVLPFGLVQVLKDLDIYDPGSPKFDPVRAVEYAAIPLHYVVNRDSTSARDALVAAIRNATLSRDLNVYRGFIPASHLETGGLATASLGATFAIAGGPHGMRHAVYVGAGPYLSTRTTTDIDPRLTSLLASRTPVVIPNAQLRIGSSAAGQAAIAITGGYRGRLRWIGGSPRDALYLAANYDYLIGFRYEDTNLALRLDTDSAGQLASVLAPLPLSLTRRTSGSGRGSALDFSAVTVAEPWQIGVTVAGVGNRITWTGVERVTYGLASLFSGTADFVEGSRVAIADAEVELPIDVRAGVAYDADQWMAVAEIGHGLAGMSVHGGVERRWRGLAVRGGARYSLTHWNPTAGIGVDLGRRVSLDVAAFATSANLEQRRLLAIAASVRVAASTRD